MPLDVINKVMLMIGKLEADVGKWCGAKKLNEKTGLWESFEGDRRQKKKGGAGVRSRKPIWMIKRAIFLCDELARRKEFTNPQCSAGAAFGISPSAMSRYMKPSQRQSIMDACKSRANSRRVHASRKVRDQFEKATQKTLEEFKAHRAKKLRVGPRWLRAKIIKNIRHFYPTKSKHFKCSEKYMRDWRKRHKISIRRRTNSKRKQPEQLRLPLQKMHAKFKSRVLMEGKDTAAFHAKAGKWLIKDRFSIDQVCPRFAALTLIFTCPIAGTTQSF